MKWTKYALLSLPALAAAMLIAGCNLAPKYETPLVDTAPAYKETNGWKQAQPSDAVLKGKWWELFGDPQLNALEEKVAISNQNVAAALQNFFAARDLVKQARSALYPTVSVNPSVIKSQSSEAVHEATSVEQNPSFTTYSLPADASWELDLWGSVRNTARSDAYTAQASAGTLENMKLAAQADLAVDYYELRGQDELIQLYTDTLKAYKDSLDLTTTLYKTGIYSALNVAQADALLETTLAQATALGIQRAQYEHAIAVLIGQTPSTFSIKMTLRSNQPPAIPIGLPSALLERRPDIATAERNAAAANAQIGVTRAAYYPTITLSGSAGFESIAVGNLFTAPSTFWSIGGAAAETLFDAGKRKAADEQAWANFRSLAATYRQTVLTAFQQVEDNLASLRILSTETGQQDVAIKASQKNLDLSLEQFRLGIASYLNVITAQESLLSNQQTAVTLREQQFTSTVQLIMALGGGWSSADLPDPGKLALKDPTYPKQ